MANLTNDINPNWKIIIEDSPSSASQAEFGPDSSTAMIPYRIPHDDVDIVPQHFVGYSYRLGGELRRILPQPHPFWGGMWANRVNTVGEVSTDRPDFVGNRTGKYDRYSDYRVDVFYGRRPYDVRGNGEVQKEQQRYVEKLPGKPYSEVVSIEKGNLIFTTKNGAPAVGADRITVPEGVSFRVGKVEIKWIWYEVPFKYILNDNILAPHINSRIGTINDNLWEGFPRGTLFLHDVDLSYTYSASSPTTLGLAAYSAPRFVNATFVWKYFSEGWNKLPYPGLGTWDSVAWANNPARSLYEETDFDALFQVVP